MLVLWKASSGGRVDGVAATDYDGDDSTVCCRIDGEVGGVERAKLVWVAGEDTGAAVGDLGDGDPGLFDQEITARRDLGVCRRAGKTEQGVIDDLMDQGAGFDQLVRLDGVVGFSVADDVEDVGGQLHGSACR